MLAMYIILVNRTYRDRKNLRLGILMMIRRIRLKTGIVLGSTEPANYAGSYTRVRKRIVHTEIEMHQGSRRTILTTTMQMLSVLKLTVSEEQEEEGGIAGY